jgi:monoamine oxidase
MSRISRDLASSAHNGTINGTVMQAIRHASTTSSGRTPTVAVIGAGMAGLRCSDVLARSGVKVTLFEARDRVGGRCHQMKCGDHMVDMGKHFQAHSRICHGPKNLEADAPTYRS